VNIGCGLKLVPDGHSKEETVLDQAAAISAVAAVVEAGLEHIGAGMSFGA
jgi:hypothetical protein